LSIAALLAPGIPRHELRAVAARVRGRGQSLYQKLDASVRYSIFKQQQQSGRIVRRRRFQGSVKRPRTPAGTVPGANRPIVRLAIPGKLECVRRCRADAPIKYPGILAKGRTATYGQPVLGGPGRGIPLEGHGSVGQFGVVGRRAERGGSRNASVDEATGAGPGSPAGAVVRPDPPVVSGTGVWKTVSGYGRAADIVTAGKGCCEGRAGAELNVVFTRAAGWYVPGECDRCPGNRRPVGRRAEGGGGRNASVDEAANTGPGPPAHAVAGPHPPVVRASVVGKTASGYGRAGNVVIAGNGRYEGRAGAELNMVFGGIAGWYVPGECDRCPGNRRPVGRRAERGGAGHASCAAVDEVSGAGPKPPAGAIVGPDPPVVRGSVVGKASQWPRGVGYVIVVVVKGSEFGIGAELEMILSGTPGWRVPVESDRGCRNRRPVGRR